MLIVHKLICEKEQHYLILRFNYIAAIVVRYNIKSIIHKGKKLDFTKIKNFCSLNDTVKKMKPQAADSNKLFEC